MRSFTASLVQKQALIEAFCPYLQELTTYQGIKAFLDDSPRFCVTVWRKICAILVWGYTTVTVIIKLAPTLKSCIETTAQREYWKRVNEYLKTGYEDKGLEERIELLRDFLETANFSKLRSQSEKHLIDGKRVTFNLSMTKGKPTYEMIVEDGP
jgi:hypothetical protein